MPLYEYKCPKCNHKIEIIGGYDSPNPSCPKCKENVEMKKLISRTSFSLKGTGWYKDHYGLKESKDSKQ